jgi:hypothetical protein
MLDVDWTATRPPLESIDQLWTSTDVDVVAPEAPAVDRYVDALAATRARGDARWCCVRIPDSPALDWYASRNCLGDADFFAHLLADDVVARELGLTVDRRPDPPVTVESALSLDGLLAEHLVHGGSRSFDATLDQQYGAFAEAKRLAADCLDDVVQDRFEEVSIHRTREAWCEWFGDPEWNLTLVAVDRRYRWAWVIVATDEGTMEAAAEQAASGAD